MASHHLPNETEEQKLSARIYEFNRYLKNECKFNSENYKLDSRAIDFLSKIEKSDLLDNDLLNIKQWDKQVYQPAMDVYRNWISENKQDILYECPHCTERCIVSKHPQQKPLGVYCL